MAQSAAMARLSRSSNPAVGTTSSGASSSTRRSALASPARTSPRASWTAVSRSSAALSVNGSSMSRARAIARSHEGKSGRIRHVAGERLSGQ